MYKYKTKLLSNCITLVLWMLLLPTIHDDERFIGLQTIISSSNFAINFAIN